MPAAVSFFSFSSFSPPLLHHHHHPPPSFPLVPLAPVCARTHTAHSVCVRLSCDLAIRDTTSTTNERGSRPLADPLALAESRYSFPGGGTPRASTFPTAPASASISRFSCIIRLAITATRGSHRLDVDIRPRFPAAESARRRSAALASTQNASRDESTTVSLS